MSSFSSQLVVLSIFDQGVCDVTGSFHHEKRLTFIVLKDNLYHDLDVPNVEAAIVAVKVTKKN